MHHLTHCAGLTVVHREGEAGQQGYEDAAFPWGTITMCSDDAVYEGIADLILDLDIVYSGPVHGVFVSEQREQWCTYDEIKNWFSIYTKCSDIWMAIVESEFFPLHRD